MSSKKICLRWMLILFFQICLTGCLDSNTKEVAVTSSTDTTTTGIDKAVNNVQTIAPIPPLPDNPSSLTDKDGQWTYRTTTDEMTGEHNVVAILDLWKADWLKGGSIASFSLTKKGGRQKALFQVSGSESSNSAIVGNKLLIRFDDNSPSYYQIIKTNNSGMPNEFSIEPARKLIAKIKKASIMRIEIQLEGINPQVVHFNVKGLMF